MSLKKREAKLFRVLFVCTGNICRSPTAEGVFRSIVDARGLSDRIEADSAGIGSWHVGEPPDARSQETARRRGVEIGDQRARTVRPDDFDWFDLLMAMDSGHYRNLGRACPPQHAGKLQMFLDYAPELGVTDVPDPYYGAGDGFERVFDMIESASAGLLAHIEANHLR
jgi:protein-tyrosine phosphatase